MVKASWDGDQGNMLIKAAIGCRTGRGRGLAGLGIPALHVRCDFAIDWFAHQSRVSVATPHDLALRQADDEASLFESEDR